MVAVALFFVAAVAFFLVPVAFLAVAFFLVAVVFLAEPVFFLAGVFCRNQNEKDENSTIRYRTVESDCNERIVLNCILLDIP